MRVREVTPCYRMCCVLEMACVHGRLHDSENIPFNETREVRVREKGKRPRQQTQWASKDEPPSPAVTASSIINLTPSLNIA